MPLCIHLSIWIALLLLLSLMKDYRKESRFGKLSFTVMIFISVIGMYIYMVFNW